jgi:hypothetical protein
MQATPAVLSTSLLVTLVPHRVGLLFLKLARVHVAQAAMLLALVVRLRLQAAK